MTPDRWRRVEDVFAEAIERDPASRQEFIERVCRDDAELRREVESLIRALEQHFGDVLESPAVPAARRALGVGIRQLRMGDRLGSYEIVVPLGAGGMGAVYLARDARLDRNVALKVISGPLADDSAARERFEREAKAVAALSHPNILAIFDFGLDGEIPYAVTELLEGETLRARIERGPVTERDALDYALQIARGLSAAHRKGIVHRDLKPENVFVAWDGHVKILDFGLSKQFEEPDRSGVPTGFSDGQTQPGAVMGTVGYMSPEQARGLPVDPRSDIFSLGAILHELLTGRRAFARKTPEMTMAAIVNEEPASRLDTSTVAPDVAVIVRRCLSKDPEHRYPTARDVEVALAEASDVASTGALTERLQHERRKRWAVAFACVGIALSVGVSVPLGRRGSPASGHSTNQDVRRIAVLPFESVGPGGREEVADGISSEVSDRLASIPGLQAIAYRASSLFRSSSKPAAEIARELEVRYLLTGRMHWRDEATGKARADVEVELLEVGNGGTKTNWQQSFEAPVSDFSSLRSTIASQVVSALGLTVSPEAVKRLVARPAVKPEAYDVFFRAEEIFRRVGSSDRTTLEQDLDLFERAVAVDPSFAEAWARIPVLCAQLYRIGVSPEAMRSRAEVAADSAERLSPDSPSVFFARSVVEQVISQDRARALEIANEGLRLSPTNPTLLNQAANLEANVDDSIRLYRQARVLDPLFGWGLGEALMMRRRYGEAMQAIEQVRALTPKNLQLTLDEANIYLMQGDLPRAREALHRLPTGVDAQTFVAFIANEPIEWDITWALDRKQLEVLLGSTSRDFGGDRGPWRLSQTVASALVGDDARTLSYAQEASEHFEQALKKQPRNYRLHASTGLALAYLGRWNDALREGELATTLMPVSQDGWEGSIALSNLVRINILVGERERALDHLERLTKLQPVWTPAWLRIDPNFDSLRDNPRFWKLVAGAT